VLLIFMTYVLQYLLEASPAILCVACAALLLSDPASTGRRNKATIGETKEDRAYIGHKFWYSHSRTFYQINRFQFISCCLRCLMTLFLQH
jgi:hypothetical protein